MVYRGRFAPSPTGPLHFGSLVCALASYLDARQQGGKWLVRMEDIDPPREEIGAKSSILNSLQKHGLQWDEDVLFQSTRTKAYISTLKTLERRGQSYRCSCTRKRLAELKGVYDGYCLAFPPNLSAATSIRLKINSSNSMIQFCDRVKGIQTEDLTKECGDFTIHRKDGLFSYQLAVVVDDIEQGITDIVRGDDLLNSTARQIFLTQTLGQNPVKYAHIPVVLGLDGHKLSKQTFAPAIDNELAENNLIHALNTLQVPTPPQLKKSGISNILRHGCEHFDLNRLHNQRPRTRSTHDS